MWKRVSSASSAQLSELMSAGRHGKTQSAYATEKGLQALPVCCCGKTRPCTRGV